MRVVLSESAVESLDSAPAEVRRAFYKQLGFLADNIQHPSLKAKEYDEARNVSRLV